MKKITLLTAAITSAVAIPAAALTSPALAVNAAGAQSSGINMINYKVIIGSPSLDGFDDLLQQLQTCFPGIVFPDIPSLGQPCPDVPSPGTPAPETPAPEDPAPEQPAPETPSPDSISSAYISKVVELVNKERAKEGLAPLVMDQRVQAAAQVRAREITVSFSHTRPDGSSFSTALKEQNVSYRRAGENIAWGQRSPEEVVTAWMNSTGHRANIMNAGFTTIGVGFYRHNGIYYWSQLFTS